MSNDEIRLRGGLGPAIRLQDFMDEVEHKLLERMSIPPTHRIFVSTPKTETSRIEKEWMRTDRRYHEFDRPL
jgi:hypothetical protein